MSSTTYAKVILWIKILVGFTLVFSTTMILLFLFYTPNSGKDLSPSGEYLKQQREAENRYRVAMESLSKEQTKSIQMLSRNDSLIISEIKTNRSTFSKEIKASNEKIYRIGNYQSPDITRAYAELEAEIK
jgi:hypothetical protein